MKTVMRRRLSRCQTSDEEVLLQADQGKRSANRRRVFHASRRRVGIHGWSSSKSLCQFRRGRPRASIHPCREDGRPMQSSALKCGVAAHVKEDTDLANRSTGSCLA
ncbi:unnamed protein product [Prorocentrum cordatum]|uniref:Uncharacterized protein n=1 Tax=Prorocentrum cordatum TaxID=2364126 RepID=A0ABN9X4L9_9DINO|nr:unnamed protein product [Polarella glacialis]